MSYHTLPAELETSEAQPLVAPAKPGKFRFVVAGAVVLATFAGLGYATFSAQRQEASPRLLKWNNQRRDCYYTELAYSSKCSSREEPNWKCCPKTPGYGIGQEKCDEWTCVNTDTFTW